jgi:DASS family divalent anion:Na+ symporter
LRGRLGRFAIVLAFYCAVTFFVQGPSRRLAGIFAATIAGLIAQPIPGGAVVLAGVTAAALFGGVTIQKALSGYSDPVVWLVLTAYFISIALLKTGLARRIALLFVRAFGASALGVCYALGFTDLVLALIVPSSGARTGGVVLPIVRSVAGLYGSEPGETARKLGAFLMVGVYQTLCVVSAMLLTGQVSNAVAARMAGQVLHYPITWVSWLEAGIVPGAIGMALVPWLVYRLYPPELRRTPEAPRFARRELAQMGPMSRDERIVCAVFAGVCGLWIFNSFDAVIPALLGACVLIVSGALKWSDIASERAAWDMFVWYGGLFGLARALNEAGLSQAIAQGVGAVFSGYSVAVLFTAAILVYFYVHYAFASTSAQVVALFPAFGLLMAAKGVPPGLAAFSLASIGNLGAGLTHYGTTPGPMFFAHGYVPFGAWWRVGFIVSLTTLLIWCTAGFAWWKFLGIW